MFKEMTYEYKEKGDTVFDYGNSIYYYRYQGDVGQKYYILLQG